MEIVKEKFNNLPDEAIYEILEMIPKMINYIDLNDRGYNIIMNVMGDDPDVITYIENPTQNLMTFLVNNDSRDLVYFKDRELPEDIYIKALKEDYKNIENINYQTENIHNVFLDEMVKQLDDNILALEQTEYCKHIHNPSISTMKKMIDIEPSNLRLIKNPPLKIIKEALIKDPCCFYFIKLDYNRTYDSLSNSFLEEVVEQNPLALVQIDEPSEKMC